MRVTQDGVPNVCLSASDRLEVQADVQKERCSLSGDSATVSLGTNSDNASTRAMAGSILNAYMPLDRSALPSPRLTKEGNTLFSFFVTPIEKL